jgi:hypothetical protein
VLTPTSYPQLGFLDALVAAWLAASYLFDESSAVVFINGKKPPVAELPPLDCTLGVWGSHDPSRFSFCAKVTDNAQGGETSVTRLLWDYLLAQGKQTQHLARLVAVVEEGKRNAAGSPSEALQSSLTCGLHAFVGQQKMILPDDHALFRAVCRWLSRYECAAWRTHARRPGPVMALQVDHSTC